MKESLGFCAACHNFNWLHNYLCPICTEELYTVTYKRLGGCYCAHCGAPLLHVDSACQCSGSGPIIVRLGLYTKGMQRILVRYKKTEVKLLSFALAALLADFLANYPNVIMVPVPCSRSSRYVRGWDQMHTIAQILTRITPHTLGLFLGRQGNTAQKNLSKHERLTAAPASYYVKQEQLRVDAWKIETCDALVVMDDVMTTGATLYTCIAKLKGSIQKPIFGLCLAMD